MGKYGEESKNSLVLDGVFGLEESLVDVKAGEGGGLALGDHHGHLELGYEISSLFGEGMVGDQQLVLLALLDTDPGSDGVLEGVEAKAVGGVVVENLVEELSALLDLEVISAIKGTLVDGASSVHLLGLALSTRDEHVQGEHVVDSELLRLDSLLEGLFVEDDLVAVDEVLLELMGEHTFEGVHIVGSGNLLDHLGHVVVELSRLDQPDGSLSGLVGSQDDIGLLAGDGGILVGLDDQGVGHEGCESVDVDSEFDLDEITFLDGGGVLLEGGEEAADFVG